MDNFIYDYFVSPIWSHEGYNIVNTLVYAAIAIVAIFIIYRLLKGRIVIDEKFVGAVLCFVLFGSTIRVVTDSIDTGVFKPVTPIHAFVIDSHLWDYGYLTVTPGIYIVTAAIFIASLLVLFCFKRLDLLGYVGLALWLPHMLLLMPFMSYAIDALPIILLAAIPAFLAYLYFKDFILSAIVAGQALDGAATFFIIDVFSKISGKQYFEQHVLSSGIGSFFGTFFAFYLLKVGIAFAAAWVLKEEKLERGDLCFIALVLMIMGFAPGIRDILRMMVGA